MSVIGNIQSDLQIASPWLIWISNIIKAAAGTETSPAISTAATTVASTASTAATASLGLSITSDVGEGFKAISSITNLVAQRDKEMNTDEMVKAANAQKLQDLRDHVAAVIDYAEKTGDMQGIRLLLS